MSARVGKPQRIALVSVIFAGLVAIVVTTFIWFTHYPAAIAATPTQPGNVSVTLQTVGAIGTEPHPPWVSYLIQRPNGQWAHTTVLKVPANSPCTSPSTSTTQGPTFAIR